MANGNARMLKEENEERALSREGERERERGAPAGDLF
jgi:hypothetical protein